MSLSRGGGLYYAVLPPYRDKDKRHFDDQANVSRDCGHLDGTLDEGQEWKAGLDGGQGNPIKTLHHILRNLDTEGFNEHSLHVIERYLDRELQGERT